MELEWVLVSFSKGMAVAEQTLLKEQLKPSSKTDDGADDSLVRLIELLQSIDTTAPLAKLNETSMPDNNGGRIKF